MAYSKTEKTESGNRADFMDEATRMPGAPAVVKNRNKQTVPKTSQVDFRPRGSHCENRDGRVGPTIPAMRTAKSVTTGMWAEGLSSIVSAMAFPIHNKADAEKKAKEMDSAVIRGASMDAVGDVVVGASCGDGSLYRLAKRFEIGKYTNAPILSMHSPVAIASGLAESAAQTAT